MFIYLFFFFFATPPTTIVVMIVVIIDLKYCCVLTFDPAKNAIQGDAPEGSDILMAVMRGNRVGGNWLMKWDELKFPIVHS